MKKYVVVQWPEVQELMDKKGFRENSYLINDERGVNDFGSSAYFVDYDWLLYGKLVERQVGEQFEYNGKLYECVALPNLGKSRKECKKCAFYDLCDPDDPNNILPVTGDCMYYERNDGTEVIFKEVE